ncbi:MAG: serine hydrolase [Gemmatimonadetes bacterium]|nr:serine hydrolase [Gemmatimonadota bacterium]MYG85472.1 serine hydrolase [Gemmatimonadota bacterium]MYJ88213.1 serine hydrolase [Gemmatimonadota bacterium]
MRFSLNCFLTWLCGAGILFSLTVSTVALTPGTAFAPGTAHAQGTRGNLTGSAGSPGAEEAEEEDPVQRVLRERVDDYGQTVGVVAGIIRGINRYVYAHGTLNRGTIRRVSGMTVFEIGQLSSLYTTAMLSLMVQRGDVSLTDEVSAYLPETVNVPAARAGNPILIEHLATHTSGLPRLPDNLVSSAPDDPLKGYSVELMYAFLDRYAEAQREGLEIPFDFEEPDSRFSDGEGPQDRDGVDPVGEGPLAREGEDRSDTPGRVDPEGRYEMEGRYGADDPFELEDRYAYSDLGMGLLGHVLERAADQSYDDLVRELLGNPLKLANTANAPTPSMQTYLATGHDDGRRPVPAWSDTTLVGGTGLRSNLLDMMTLVSASMGIIYALPEDFTEDDSTRYHASFDSLIVARNPTDEEGVRTALGWKVRQDGRGRDIHWLTGRTNGFYAFAAFLKEWRKGVVVLSNSSASVEDIGFHLLSARNPLAPPPRNVVQMTETAYVACTGTYAFSPEFTVDITFSDGKLYGQPPGQPRSELILESSGDFYLEDEDARITFVPDEEGNVDHFLFLQDGQTHRAERVR